MDKNAGLMTTVGQIFTSPTQAFESIKTQGRAWFPLITIILSTILLMYFYFSSVDFQWFIERTVEISDKDLSSAQKEQAINLYLSIGKDKMMYGMVGSMVIFLPLLFCLFALYFLIVSNIRNDNLRFGDAFNIACWSNLVSLVPTLVGFAHIAISDSSQISQTLLKGLNINDLLFNIAPDNIWYSFMTNFDLSYIWISIISGLGYKVYAKTSLTTGIIIGFIPFILINGVWALIILL
ncbi:YIP1 family protein [Pleionea sediminis]|uniref:YIP1 family protein n=1 Tax=Pleionea sediminis TaxID=2569479 RepID=UPI0013DDFDBB|nr:YIP1 family protein [Pleionea sediminis]